MSDWMEVSELKGKGLNVGKTENGLEGIDHYYVEPNNFYTLKKKCLEETLDFIISKDLIFSTKYHRILLKEWMNSCKVGGSIIIIFKERGGKDIQFLSKELFCLFGNSIEVDREKRADEVTVAIRKKEPVLEKNDDISKWSFGILANGKRDEQVDKIIELMLGQKIPHLQIIVCGKYANGPGYKITYVPFSEKDEKGWITRKKNLIVENAEYENVVVIHDRIFLDRDWYAGMKKYGNYFEVLSCVILDQQTGKRSGDWVAHIPNIAGHLDYKDWDENLYINGVMYILKKNAWRKAPWNEQLFWNEAEDFELSERYHKLGVVPRFNPYSKCYTPPTRFKFFEFRFNNRRLGDLKMLMPTWAYSLALSIYYALPKPVLRLVKNNAGKR